MIELSDDVEFDVPVAQDRTAITIRDNITRMESSLSEFDAISAGLADLAARFPHDLAYAVATTKGEN